MNQRPLSVTLLACVYLVMGAAGFAYHLTKLRQPFSSDLVWVGLLCLLAIAGGVYMLRGHNWARWLALAWMAYHVVLSAFHTLPQLAIHGLFCAIVAFCLFHPGAGRYFRPART